MTKNEYRKISPGVVIEGNGYQYIIHEQIDTPTADNCCYLNLKKQKDDSNYFSVMKKEILKSYQIAKKRILAVRVPMQPKQLELF